MLSKSSLLAILSLTGASNAWLGPTYNDFKLRWQDPFIGPAGTLPSSNNWNIITGNLGVNAELETYTSSVRNVQLSGGSTLQLVPWRDRSATQGWTSGRVESRYVFTPEDRRITRVEASLRIGKNPAWQQQGMWPAFWMLGDALRNGAHWPASGELDIMEQVNGLPTGYGTLHCDQYPGGRCNEPTGLSSSIAIPAGDWHVWRLEVDRTKSRWQDETIQWSLDGQVYHSISGAQIGDWTTWNAVAHSPLYFILNMAVGGTWPGYPNDNTVDGYGSMLEVGYVAHYGSF